MYFGTVILFLYFIKKIKFFVSLSRCSSFNFSRNQLRQIPSLFTRCFLVDSFVSFIREKEHIKFDVFCVNKSIHFSIPFKRQEHIA